MKLSGTDIINNTRDTYAQCRASRSEILREYDE